jgi:hypothetical protein
MRTIPNNLQIAYYKLKKSRLIKENEIDDDAITYFETTLNNGLPKSEQDFIIYYFIKNLFYNDKAKFYNYINNSQYECLLLYTDNLTISNHFDLVSKIYINWDKNKKVYKILKK